MNFRILTSCLCVIFAVFNLSCEISEPDRFYNEAAAPPKSAIFTLEQLQGGVVANGKIYVSIDTAGINFPIWYMYLYVANGSDTKIWSAGSYPYIFEVDTRELSDGMHNLEVRVYNMEPSHGMLNMYRPASLYIQGKIYTNNQPPVPTEFITVDFNEQDVPLIRWKNEGMENFLAYVIYRGIAPWNDYNYQDYWTPIDTIYDQSIIAYEDNSIAASYGQTLYYRIKTYTNFSEPGALSEEAHKTLGAVNVPGFVNCLLTNKKSGFIYYISSTGIIIGIDPQTDSVITTAEFQNIDNIIQNESGDELYVLSCDNHIIYILDAIGLNMKRYLTLQPQFNYLIAPGKGDQIVIHQNNGFKVIDTKSGKTLQEYKDSLITSVFDVDVSPDYKYVYLNAMYDNNYYIIRVNIENGVPVYMNKAQIEIDGGIYGFSENNLLYEMRGGAFLPDVLNVRDASTLNIVRTITNQNKSLDYALIGKNGIYLTSMNSLISIDMRNYETIKTWPLISSTSSICLTNDEKYLYAGLSYENLLLKIKL